MKKAQTHILMLALIIGAMIVALVIVYNVVKVYVAGEKYDPWAKQEGLLTIKPGSSCKSNQNCNDKNDCTDDFCKNKICEYTNKTDDSACLLEEIEGVCKNGECIPK